MDTEIGTLVPYVFNGVTWSIPDEAMLNLFEQLKENNITDKLFYGMDINAVKFFSIFKNPANQMHVFWLDDLRPGFMAWLNSWGYNYAFAHFTGFPWTWGKRTQEYTKQTLAYWFGFNRKDGTPLLDLILGLTPANNRLAVRAAKRAGFSVLAEVPDIQFGPDPVTKVGGVYTVLNRKDFENGRQQRPTEQPA